ncbi:polysaccharide lyase family 7 protein [Flavobacterium sp. NG2]|uniref:polysaccharide lyase family 7 protein n=1 Tax=Flavobacterium sp. NG2 TaxID=3097547 RepID=UPI002A7F0986|nr:polysaccharide lyase family 7 protein [Flavobacterium sp. NG2]WPR72138.1 polysaccharide lyase family 7 protein [Flavobacterium sp. NG2]
MDLNFSKTAVLVMCAVVAIGYSQDKKSKKKTANIDLSHWTVTVPEEDPNKPGKPIQLGYPEILDYNNIEGVKKYMYDDPKDKSIVFYAYPSGTSTANSHYSRSELRETMVVGDNNVNWTFAQGGYFKGTYAIEDISKEPDGKYSRVIIAQIHGRLTNEQRQLIGQKDNNAAPILKIYWDKGKIRVKTKVLKDLNAEYKDMLSDHAWGDDEGRNFKEKVDFNKFTLEIKVSDGRLEVVLNGTESFVYDDIHIKKWGVFENYFKAGNYFQSKTPGTFAKVKIYSLEATH